MRASVLWCLLVPFGITSSLSGCGDDIRRQNGPWEGAGKPLIPGSKPFGKTYDEWVHGWWQWALAIPDDGDHPLKGGDCTRDQDNPSLWFLGAEGGDFSCTIPNGRGIMIPVAKTFCSACPEVGGEAECEMASAGGVEACVQRFLEGPIDLSVKIDGVEVEDIGSYLATSGAFELQVVAGGQSVLFSPEVGVDCSQPWAEGNACSAATGPKQAAGGGVYVIINPPTAGDHTISCSGSVGEGEDKQTVDTTWNITVEAPKPFAHDLAGSWTLDWSCTSTDSADYYEYGTSQLTFAASSKPGVPYVVTDVSEDCGTITHDLRQGAADNQLTFDEVISCPGSSSTYRETSTWTFDSEHYFTKVSTWEYTDGRPGGECTGSGYRTDGYQVPEYEYEPPGDYTPPSEYAY